MALALTTGTAGVKQRNYRVFIAANDYNFDWAAICANIVLFNTAIVAKYYTTAYTKFALVLAAMTEVGECRADSVESLISDGNSIDGNTLGKLVLSKTGSFNAELINATPENIARLASMDGKEVIIILTETDGHDEFFAPFGAEGDVLSTDSHKVIFICNYDSIVAGVVTSVGRRLSISNKETGSGIITVSLAIENNVPNAASFRAIKSVPYSIASHLDPFAAIAQSPTSIVLNWDGGGVDDHDGFLIDVSSTSSFVSFITGWQNKYISAQEENVLVEHLTPDTDYYFRICAVKNGRIISSYSEILNVKTPVY